MENPMLSGSLLDDFLSGRSKNLAQFNAAAETLEVTIRRYLHGDDAKL